jgi:hypothetical protein
MVHLAFDVGPAEIDELVIAGWTGRDVEALNHHIEELKAIGVPPPSSMPLYYRAAAQLLTQADTIDVLGEDTSGEVEPVLVGTPERLWVTLGSDHTDRKAETFSVAVAKQICAKAIGRTAWRFEDVEPQWDRLILRSFVEHDGQRTLYQEGALAAIRPARQLIQGWQSQKRLPAGVAMFMGTLPAIGGIRPSKRFAMELEDPTTGRKLSHAYSVRTLPIVS